MAMVVLSAPGKVNFSLEITGKRQDGYHNLKMLNHAVSLEDTIYLNSKKEKGIELSCTNSAVPCDKRNLAYKAVEIFFDRCGGEIGLDIFIEKRIPIEAGMAGGSADAAAVLLGLDQLLGTNYSPEDLCEMGLALGADVPFCLWGGAALVEGIGEKIKPLPALASGWLVVAKPPQSMKTAACFQMYDELSDPAPVCCDEMLFAYRSGDLAQIGKSFNNALAQVVPFESVENIRQKMLENGAFGSLMSGSGSAVFGLFADKRSALHCARKLYQSAQSVFVVRPVDYGAKITYAD